MFMKVFACAALIVVLGGCQQIGAATAPLDYTSGVNVSAAQMAGFIDKKSTQNDVISQIGQPGSKAEVLGKEVWSYAYSFGPGIPFTGKKDFNETTVFEFDKHGVLINHYKTAASAGMQ
ncbi:hypothetical protein [Pseudomonas sp.]|uniref:hypothetical protein n=1 Tax=Pseudomonas sp. TaxID=306 RepID=UPI003FD72E23